MATRRLRSWEKRRDPVFAEEPEVIDRRNPEELAGAAGAKS
jgi:hypothetical protein